MVEKFDFLVLGGGVGIYSAERVKEEFPKKRVGVASDDFTETCANMGCAPKWGLHKAIEDGKDWSNIRKQIIFSENPDKKNYIEEVIKSLNEKGIETYQSKVKFNGLNSIILENGNEIHAEKFLIVTGSSPNKSIPIDGLSNIPTSDEFFIYGPEEIPGRVGFLGSGVISSELGDSLNHLGADVTIIGRDLEDNLLGQFDSKLVKKLLEKERMRGIKRIFEKNVLKVDSNENEYLVFLDDGDVLSFEEVYNTMGRSANIDLDLEKAGIDFSNRGISVNQYMQTSNKNVYAAGDCVGEVLIGEGIISPQLEELAHRESRVAVSNIVNGNSEVINYNNIGKILFTTPMLGSVGLSNQKISELPKDMRDKIIKRSNDDIGYNFGEWYGSPFSYEIYTFLDEKVIGAHYMGNRVDSFLNPSIAAIDDSVDLEEFARRIGGPFGKSGWPSLSRDFRDTLIYGPKSSF